MITVITPTHDRPAAWPLIERWMKRQTVQPDQWIVADDGQKPAPLTMGQTRVRASQVRVGASSLIHNLLGAINQVKGDTVLIMEDDDYYRANHIEVCMKHLANADATGCDRMMYYNVRMRAWMELPNTGSALCNTAFNRKCLPLLAAAAGEALGRGVYHVDRYFWQRVRHPAIHKESTVVGIKGLPGTVGLGIGHRDGKRWIHDPDFNHLRKWIGEDAEYYANFYQN